MFVFLCFSSRFQLFDEQIELFDKEQIQVLDWKNELHGIFGDLEAFEPRLASTTDGRRWASGSLDTRRSSSMPLGSDEIYSYEMIRSSLHMKNQQRRHTIL